MHWCGPVASTSDALLAAVRRATFSPDVSDWTDADLLALADEEIATIVSQAVKAGREGHWLAHDDIAIVPGTTTYAVPRRALAQGLRGAQVVTPEGQTYDLTPIDPLVLRTYYETNPGTGLPVWYSFEGNVVSLGSVPPIAGYTLRAFYLRAPSSLILTAAAVPVVSVASATELTVTGTPDTTTFAAGAEIDVVSGVEPFPVLLADLVVATAGAGTVEVTTSVFSSGTPPAAVQNREPAYVCPASTTVYPQIPRAMWPSLVRATAASYLEAIRDPGADVMRQRAGMAMRSAIDITEPRDDRRAQSIVGSSALRARHGRRWR